MKKFCVVELREKALEAIRDTGAFLRLSRSDDLFVTDAPRKTTDIENLQKRLENEFRVRLDGGLMYLTPHFPDQTEKFSKTLVSLLKETGEKREKLLRNSLAEAMRLKNTKEIEILTNILKEDSQG